MNSAAWLGAGAALSLAGAAWLGVRWCWPAHAAPAAQPAPGRPEAPALRRGQLPVRTGAELLQSAGVSGTLARLRANAGLSTTNFDADMWPVIERVAEFVQQLPASEAHHHSQPGGLLLHILEVADAALRIRRGRILPVGSPSEKVAKLEHRWTYGVFLGAMLHDIGRPMADLRVRAFRTPDGDGELWIPMTGSLVAHGAVAYSVDFPLPAERDYAAHQRLPVVLMQQLVPQRTMLWLGADPQLVRELNAFLSGDHDAKSPISEIVQAADRESVAANLLGGPRTRFRTARAVPLIERLMGALRRMVAEGHLPVNQTGFSAGWSDDTSLWMVPKTVADAVREYLARHESGEGAGAGIPADNNRLFDTWQEYGAVIPNPAGGALWDILVESAGSVKSLNALRFRLDRVYGSPDCFPKPFAGDVRVLGAAAAAPDDNGQASGEAAAGASGNPDAGPAAATPPGPDAQAATPRDSGTDHAAVPGVPEGGMAGGVEPTVLDAKDSAAAGYLPVPATAPEGNGKAGSVQSAPPVTVSGVRAMRTGTVNLKQALKAMDDDGPQAGTTEPAPAIATDDGPLAMQTQDVPVNPYAAAAQALEPPLPLAGQFIEWLRADIAAGALPFNRAGSPVHFVADGMLLVSPAVFRLFQQKSGMDSDPKGYVAVQTALIRSRLAIESGRKDYLHAFVVDNATRRSKLTCLLLAQPERWFQPVPPPNPLLRRFDPERDAGMQRQTEQQHG